MWVLVEELLEKGMGMGNWQGLLAALIATPPFFYSLLLAKKTYYDSELSKLELKNKVKETSTEDKNTERKFERGLEFFIRWLLQVVFFTFSFACFSLNLTTIHLFLGVMLLVLTVMYFNLLHLKIASIHVECLRYDNDTYRVISRLYGANHGRLKQLEKHMSRLVDATLQIANNPMVVDEQQVNRSTSIELGDGANVAELGVKEDEIG